MIDIDNLILRNASKIRSDYAKILESESAVAKYKNKLFKEFKMSSITFWILFVIFLISIFISDQVNGVNACFGLAVVFSFIRLCYIVIEIKQITLFLHIKDKLK